MRCPTSQTLIDYQRKKLPLRRMRQIEDHLANACDRCREELEWLGKVSKVISSDDLRQPSPTSLEKAIELFGSKTREIRRLVARLMLDSRRTPRYQGVRTGGTKSAYLVYRAEGVNVDLALRPGRGEGRMILGQVMPDEGDILDIQSVEVKLLEKERMVTFTRTNPLGEFVFDDIPRGTYGVKVDWGASELEIEDLVVS